MGKNLNEWMKSEAAALRREAARLERSEYAATSGERVNGLRQRADRLEAELVEAA